MGRKNKEKSESLPLVNIKASSSSSPQSSSPQSSGKKKFKWEVNYSRFFTQPDDQAPTAASASPLSKKRRFKGTWLPCQDTASLSLFLLPDADKKKFGLAVSQGADRIEEHAFRNLVFSWPQVSCVPLCPIRGSRVVFISFKDQSSQIQKFAVRFSDSSIAEEFINCVKECSKEMNGKPSKEKPSKEMIAKPSKEMNAQPSKEMNAKPSEEMKVTLSADVEIKSESGVETLKHYYQRKKRRTIELNNGEEPIMMWAPKSLDFTINANYINEDKSNIGPVEPLMAFGDLDSLLGLPPSFTDLLNNCSSTIGPGQIVQGGVAYNSYQNSLPIETPHNVKVEPNDSDLMAQIMTYMNDDSFQATVCKIEKLIGELGGDWVF